MYQMTPALESLIQVNHQKYQILDGTTFPLFFVLTDWQTKKEKN